MNERIRHLAIALLVCFVALFVQLNRVQVFGRADLVDSPLNTREIIRDFGEERGRIATADGVVVAESVPVDGQLERERRYPQGELYAHITGHFSFNFGATGVEEVYNDELAGQSLGQKFGDLEAFFAETDTTGNLTLTVRSDVQQVARDALGNRRGSIVALDPRTGDILAMWSFPSYDPNLLSTVDLESADAARAALEPDSLLSPLLPKTYRRSFPPGSTFKAVTAAAGLSSGITPTRPVFPPSVAYMPPLTTATIGNFGGVSCGGDLATALRDSCNTVFAEMGAEWIGPDVMIGTAGLFGFNEQPPIDLPAAAASTFPETFGAPLGESDQGVTIVEDTPLLAQASIGQNNVAATPLQMALVAAAVANEGLIMEPHVMAEIRDQDGGLVETYEPSVWRPAMTRSDAETLRRLMVEVVTSGTATGLAVPGFEVAGKTGTAQIDPTTNDTHAWIIGFGGPPGQPPTVAVAVIVEATEGGGQQTGGTVAAPIAQAVLAAALAPLG